MTDRHPRLFPDLAPPPGGLARLRARVDGIERRRARLLTLVFVPSLAVATALFLVVTRAPGAAPDPFAGAVAHHPSLASPHEGQGVVAGGARALPVALSAGATLYWVP